MSWNNTKGFANWAGSGNSNFVLPSNLVVSSIQTNYLSTGRINVSSIYTNALNASTINTNALNASSIFTNFISSANGNIQNLNTSTIATNFLHASSISTRTITSQVGYFSTIYVDDIIGLSTSINVISFSTITRSLAVDNISRFEQPFITFNSDVVFKNDFKANAISTNHISSGSIVADSFKGKISTNEAVIYSTEEVNGSIVFTTPNGDFGGSISGSYVGGLSIFAQNDPMTFISYDTINILGLKDMLHLISTNYIFSAGETALFNASNIELNSYNVGISTSLVVVNSTTTDYLFANNISSGSFITSNLNVVDISCNNITVSNVTDANILNVGGQTTLNGATTANQDIFVNANINMKYDTLSTLDPAFLPPYEYFQKDITNVRNLNAASLTIIGGATSNTEIGIFVPPFHYNSVVTIGNEDGITSPGVVVINGQNPGFGENITNALTVRGDMAVDFGVLTTYNGLVCEPFDVEANAIEVNGIAEFNGLVNILGVDILGLSVEGGVDVGGYVNVGGIFTTTGIANINGGTAIVGGLLQSGGDFTIGSSGYSGTIDAPLTINETTSFNGNVTMNADLDMANHDILNVRNLNVSTITSVNANLSTLRLFSLSTTQILLYPDQDFPPAIAFTDLSANVISVITSINESLFMLGTSSILIQANSNLLMGGSQNAGIVGSTITLNASSNITLFAPETIYLQSSDAGIAINGQNSVVIGNQQDTSLYLTLDNMEGFASTNMTFNAGSNFIINANSNLQGGNIFLNNDTIINSISTNSISTNNLFTSFLSTSQINTSSIRANNISSIFEQVSSMRVQNTLQASTIQVNRLQPLTDSGTQTQNLYPQSAGSQIGFFGSGGTNSGGFYGQVNARSTLTQVIVPDIVGAFSNNIRIQGNVSTQNVFVSSINNKRYPCRSTIGGPSFPSSFSIDGNISATPQLLISSINFFAGVGNYDISQRMVYIKQTGGASVDAHGSILVASTNSLAIPFIDSNFGYGQIPQVNDVGHSTFTTMVTSVFIGSNSQERQYKYLDATGGNYTGRLYLERPVITYIPSFGINPE